MAHLHSLYVRQVFYLHHVELLKDDFVGFSVDSPAGIT
jgi:hypothetical protein